MFFEDDVVVVGSVAKDRVLAGMLHGFELAKDTGMVYLGLCPIDGATDVSNWGGFSFSRGGGRCAHAFALNRKLAATLWAFLETPQAHPPSWYTAFRTREIMDGWPIFMDTRLNSYTMHHPAVIVSTHGSGHFPQGIFHQDRNLFPSAIDS